MIRRSLAAAAWALACISIAGAQPSGAVRFLSHLIPPQGGSFVAGCWGWTDTAAHREYALLGSYCGTSIVEITNGASPVERAFVPGVCSEWHEIQVYNHYAYVVSEGGGGTQIIDLSYLPDSAHLVKNFNYAIGGSNISRAHTIHIDDSTMYLNGCANWGAGGIVIFTLADPVNPAYQGAYEAEYIHDCFVRHDTIYGAAIYGQGVDIIDATNKTSPHRLWTYSYPGAGTHNCATTADGAFLLTTDEIGSTAKTLKVWDLRTPPSFPKVGEYVGSPTAIVHNVFVKGTKAFMSYYTKGLKVVDIANPQTPVEIGGYDSYPADDHTDYTGAWSTYPYFPSGKIIIGDMVTGLYVVDMDTAAPNVPVPFAAYSDYTTPSSVSLTWSDPTSTVGGAPIAGLKIHLYRDGVFLAEVDSGVGSYTDTGRTLHLQYTYSITAVVPSDSSGSPSSSAYAGGNATPSGPSAFGIKSAIGGVNLSWVNPSRQIDGTPLNDLAAIRILRDGSFLRDIAQTMADTGEPRTAFDSTLGYHTYAIEAYDNEAPVHYSSVSPTLTAGNLYTTYTQGFESLPSYMLTSGSWDTTSALSHGGGVSITDSRIGNYADGTTSWIQTPPVIVSPGAVLRYSHIAIIAFGDFGFVEISANNGASYTVLRTYNQTMRPEWQDSVAGPDDWYTDVFNLAAYTGDTVVVRFRMVTNISGNLDGWYIDDILIGDPSAPQTATAHLATGWNMVSLPLDVADPRKGVVYPGASSQAFSFSGSGYVPADSLDAGGGYWVKYPGAATVSFSGPAIMRDTIPLHARWNLIGGIGDRVAAASVHTLPAGILTSPFYTYNGGYAIAPSVAAGRAYWVKSSQDGALILSEYLNGAEPEALPKGGAATSSLLFTDAAGQRQELHFSGAGADEMPPPAPEGAFDVRFGGSRGDELSIIVRGAVYPLRVSWNMRETGALLSDGRTVPLAGEGSATFDAPVGAFRLIRDARGAAPETPAVFALLPNYPNPFNPATTITLAIASPGHVSLRIFDVAGREVATLIDGHRGAGEVRVRWDASALPSGVYYARASVTSGNGSILYRGSGKLLYLK